jgi:nicotinate dehydrogenase subunit A
MQATTPDISKTQTLPVNRRALITDVDGPDTPLFCVLRNELGLHGPRFGSGLGGS